MLRRTIALALAGLVLAAPPALASSHYHWNSQMKDAAATASRSAGGCTIKKGWRRGSLVVSCKSRHTATLVYVFQVGHSGYGSSGIQGTPTSSVSWWGRAGVHRSVKVSGNTLRVTVSVTGGTAQVFSVSAGYYTH